MIPRVPTRSDDTERHYQNRVRLLKKNCKDDTGVAEPTIAQFATWFETRVSAGRWRGSTFRQYRAALAYEAERLVPNDTHAVAAADRLRALEHQGIKRQKGAETRKEHPRTSSKKQRSFPPDDLAKIQRLLLGRRWSHAVLAISWLRVGVLTGMRPDEHFQAKVTKGVFAAPFKVALRIRNGKDSNGRAHGKFRHLGLDCLEPSDLAVLEQHFAVLNGTINKIALETGRSRAEVFKWLQLTVANRVSRAGIQLWPRRNQRPVMYSTRHQFIADCKAAGISRKELAAMVGHATEETAGKHYARAGAGRNAVVVQPHPSEVLRIRPGRTGRYAALKGKSAKAKSGK